VTQVFRLNPAETYTIEATAYNGAGLIATEPYPFYVNASGVSSREPPRMYVLAIGIDKYRPPLPRLNYAAKDAKTFASALAVVGGSLFSQVLTTTLVDDQVSVRGIGSAIDAIAREARPNDVFMLFLAGHGRSIAGRYYYYPQSLDFEANQSVEEFGIGQDKWQAWLAKVDAQKSVLIFDTCESAAAGALIRGVESARQTAMDQLQHATGQNLIAAAREAAHEGFKDHGILTYVLLEALNKADSAGGGEDEVKIFPLAEYAEKRVPQITQQVFGVSQRPIYKLSGNFPIGIRRAVLRASDADIPTTPTHVLSRNELVRERPQADAPSQRELTRGFMLTVVEITGDWALVAREGQKIGYLPADALLRAQ
jgi:uncharacterized caspase-like protein